MAKKIYSIYSMVEVENGSDLLQKLVLNRAPSIKCVRHGFNWLYGIPVVNFFAAMFRRFYRASVVLLFISIMPMILNNFFYIGGLLSWAIWGSFFALAGRHAGSLMEKTLIKNGYKLVSINYAANETEAIMDFVKSHTK